MKKILSALLALLLCLCLGATVMASSEPSGDASLESNEHVGNYGTTVAYNPVNLTSGEMTIDGETIFALDSSAIQNSGTSEIIVRNSYITGDTTAETAPLAGNPGNLLVAGNVRTTLALGQAHSYYINSTIVSRNWAALSTDGAVPVTTPGQSELSLYAYGTLAKTTDGGYGAYSDLFCNLYSYGSYIQAAEIGIISGTYGKVTVGTIADGEKNMDMVNRLSPADMIAQPDKEQGSIITGGRNAIMIHSVNLPPYWEYEGYSREELPLYSTPVTVTGSILETDMSLDKGVAYEPQKQAYIDHTAGSVILVKSTNTDIQLTDCKLIADPDGSGAILHTVYNNDTMFMNSVPDGLQYPGVKVSMTDMAAVGDIIHEDYQRNLYLILSNASLTGAVNGYDCTHWNKVAQDEGFTDYALDANYTTPHGVYLNLVGGSSWTVTGESHISGLTIDETSSVQGVMAVNGTPTLIQPGTYMGNIVLFPAG